MSDFYGLEDFGDGSLTSLGLPTATGGGGGGFNVLDALSGLPGGLPGLGLSMGSQLLSFLGGLSGSGKRKDLYKQLGNLANIGQGQIGKPIYDVGDVEAESVARATPRLQAEGRRYDKRYGFDQGASGKAFGDMFSQFLGELLPGLRTREAELRSGRDRNLLSTIAGIRNSQAALI